MAAGNSNNSGGGNGSIFIAILALIILFWPIGLTGGEEGSEVVLIIWWLVLICIVCVINSASKAAKSNSAATYIEPTFQLLTPKIESEDQSYVTVSEETLKADTSLFHEALMDNYNEMRERVNKLNREIDDILVEQANIDSRISGVYSKINKIKEFDDKPFWMPKRKYLKQREPDLLRMQEDILQYEKRKEKNEDVLKHKKDEIAGLKIHLSDETDHAYELLKDALDQIKQSCHISGAPDIKRSDVDVSQRNKDLRNIQCKIEPYSMRLNNYRFYFFPNVICVFSGWNKLVGIYKTKAIQGSIEVREIPKTENMQHVYDDTTVIKKDIAHENLYTDAGGSQDISFTSNPVQTNDAQQEYYLECSVYLTLCGWHLKYEVSSYNNCELLQKAISAYASKDRIPMLLELLQRCSIGDDVQMIKKHIGNHDREGRHG